MKNSKKNKLSLSKIKVAALKDLNSVKGGAYTDEGRPTNSTDYSYYVRCRDEGDKLIG